MVQKVNRPLPKQGVGYKKITKAQNVPRDTIGSIVCKFKVKGLVHPKMKIKSLITHPHAVPTP